jgi:hypothetical protein
VGVILTASSDSLNDGRDKHIRHNSSSSRHVFVRLLYWDCRAIARNGIKCEPQNTINEIKNKNLECI